jgi:serine/threonine protein kinase
MNENVFEHLSPDRELPGTIGKYQVTGLLGRGARGIVYRGCDPQIRRDVAIKTLAGLDYQAGEDTLSELMAEARLAGNLRHPNIVTIFELSTKSSPPFLVMDYVEGESLEGLLLREKKLEPSLALHILAQIASALDYSHRSGIIHKDLKPANIVIDRYGDAFILDFGIAAFFEILDRPVALADAKGPAFGTPGYMSPEQILNNMLDHRSDLFSFAVIAFECLTGCSPFLGLDIREIAESIFQQKQPAISTIAPELSPYLDDTFSKAFSIDRSDRFSTATDLVERLANDLSVDTTRVHSKFRISLEVKSETEKKRLEKIPEQSVVRRATKPDARQTISGTPKPFSHPFAPAVKKDGLLNHYSLSSASKTLVEKRPGTLFQGAEINEKRNKSKINLERPFGKQKNKIQLGAFLACVFLMTISGAFLFSSSYIASAEDGSDLKQLSRKYLALEIPSEFLTVAELSNSQLMRILIDENVAQKRKMDAILEVRVRRSHELVELAPTLLSQESSELRQETLLALAELGDKRAVPSIVNALKDGSDGVRREAAAALSKLPDRRARGYLVTQLNQEQNPYVKEQLQLAIKTIDGV